MAMETINNKMKELVAARDVIKGLPGNSNLSPEALCAKEPMYKLYCAQIEALNTNGSRRELFFQDVQYRLARSVGDLIDGRIKSTGDRLLVPVWDSVIDGIIKFWHVVTSALFHESKKSFTPEELDTWADIIGVNLEGFGKLIKGRMMDESRSNDKTARAFAAEDQSVVNQDQIICDRLLNHYATQCEYYALAIENRMNYYSQGTEVVFIAQQLRDWLLEIKTVILSIKSLKEVSAKFGQNITMITEMSTNIKNLFAKLSLAVAPRNSSVVDRATRRTAGASQSQRHNYRMDDDSEYPMGS